MSHGIAGDLPYRLALCGGWIDQPFISQLNPDKYGSMTTINLEPVCRFMDFAGMATSTRKTMAALWGDAIPAGDAAQLVRELYWAENEGRADPSGAQDMAGLIYPGIVRVDFSFAHEGGVLPSNIESCTDPKIVAWAERHLRLLPINQRPPGYSPLGRKRLEPEWVARLGRSGQDCFAALLQCNLPGLQSSMAECMAAWDYLLPDTLEHPLVNIDLKGLVACYTKRYGGAMFSGCGGGYLIVATDQDVPGSFGIEIRKQLQ